MNLSSGAECEVSGTISAFAKWAEDMYFRDASGAMDISDIDFYFQFRRCADQTSADVTLSTNAGTLSIEEDDGSVESILRISAASGTFSSYVGDMVADLVAVDADGNEFHYAHGVVTFTNDPVAI